LYKELKDQGAKDFDIFVRQEGNKPVHLFLDHAVDDFGAHAISLAGGQSVVVVNAPSMLLGGDAQDRAKALAKVLALQDPFDLWVVNAHGTKSTEIEMSRCTHRRYASSGGHLHDHHHCMVKSHANKSILKADQQND
jgi:hypothetical protein